MTRFRIERLNDDDSTSYEYFSDRLTALETAETFVLHGRNQYVSVWTKNRDGEWDCDAEVQNFGTSEDPVVETIIELPFWRELFSLDQFSVKWDAIGTPVAPIIRAYFSADYANYHIVPRDELMVFDEYDPVFKHPQFAFEEKRTEVDFEDLFEQIDNYGYVTLDCGCNVEPDGRCQHGNESPLLAMGLI